jgi:hypothetical protein
MIKSTHDDRVVNIHLIELFQIDFNQSVVCKLNGSDNGARMISVTALPRGTAAATREGKDESGGPCGNGAREATAVVPLMRESHDRATPTPSGVTRPSPVTPTRRISHVLPVGRTSFRLFVGTGFGTQTRILGIND